MQAQKDRATIPETELLRAGLYRLLARALSRPADREFIDIVSSLQGDDSDLGQAFGALSNAARNASVDTVAEEYQNLFIGLGRGELLPFGSYYLTGFLNEKPLARLRNDMAALGIARAPGHKEPEDHAGALADMMAGLIEGAFGAPADMATQRDFFRKHLHSWMPHFFGDLEKAKHAEFYKPVGTLGRLFMEIEEAAFEM